MTPLPAVLGAQGAPNHWRLELDITDALDCFEGHFPGLPIVPGVAQIDWAIRLARARFILAPRFQGLSLIKFMRVIQPPRKIELDLRADDDGRELSFRYYDAGGTFSSGRMGFSTSAGT